MRTLEETRAEIDKAFNDNSDVFAEHSNWMNDISSDIKRIELTLRERGVKYPVDLTKNIDGIEYQLSWKHYKPSKAKEKTKGCFRLVVSFNGEERPLLEQPFHVRGELHPYMGEFINHISYVLRTETLRGRT